MPREKANSSSGAMQENIVTWEEDDDGE